ncbi:hypothetical protein [Alloactinosynnema sp. L-07]|nr:hypothetical protein [Alloactinosynnema sp. L-07]
MWRETTLWQAVASEIRGYRSRGLARVLTEDTIRFATVRALVDAGVEPTRLRVEWPHVGLTDSLIDLVVVDVDRPAALIGFKYPREPNEKNAAWTLALGGALQDFYVLAAYPGVADRLLVHVETARLHRRMEDSTRRYGLEVEVEEVAIVAVDDSLRLVVYEVSPLGSGPSVVETAASGDAVGTRDGARREILAAVRAVLIRSGGETFTPAEIVAEMIRRGTGYAESTIRTMVTAHMCANAPDNAGTTYDDLVRIDRGRYRLARGNVR